MRGKSLTRIGRMQAIVARAGMAAGIGVQCYPHMLLHARGFVLPEAGTDTRLSQDDLGHRDIKSTVIYTETSQRRLSGVRVRWSLGN
jgi:type 1 fimbriae regulatory protein FimE